MLSTKSASAAGRRTNAKSGVRTRNNESAVSSGTRSAEKGGGPPRVGENSMGTLPRLLLARAQRGLDSARPMRNAVPSEFSVSSVPTVWTTGSERCARKRR